MAAHELMWPIANSKLPSYMKLTLYTLALVADAKKGYANLFLSKAKIGSLSSRGERVAREDIADLVAFGVLTVVAPGGGAKRSTTYQLWFEQLTKWTDADTEKLQEIRRLRRARYPKNQFSKPGSVLPGKSKSGTIKNPDPYCHETRIRTAAEPGSVPPGIRTALDSESDLTVAERGIAPEHAVENSAAPRAESSNGGARPSMYLGPPNTTRHRRSLAESVLCDSSQPAPESPDVAESPRSEAGPPRQFAGAFHILSDSGRRWLAKRADEGPVQFPCPELRSHLRSIATNLGIRDGELLASVEDSLESQHRHFLTSTKGGAAPPREKTAVRPANAVAP